MTNDNWCHCVPANGSSRGWTLNPLNGVWVCSTCRLPSRATYEVEDICCECGFPSWWVDNECPECGMSFDEAMSEVHGRMQA
jgi:predicted amidophosphoribosyltransferase